MCRIEYDTEKYPFSKIVAEHFEVDTLTNLHQKWEGDPAKANALTPGLDQKTPWHEHFYKIGPPFFELYQQFIRENFGHFNFFQAVPSFRTSFPESKAVGGCLHADGDYGHPENEINILMPLTPMFGSNALLLESKPNLGDFQLIQLNPGQCLIFDGRNCRHGNVINNTGITRVSLDFRVLNRFPNITDTSISRGLSFAEGSYYKRIW